MENDPRLTSKFLVQPTFDPDLVPMYALTEQQYQMLIKDPANFVVATIGPLQRLENGHLASIIALQA